MIKKLLFVLVLFVFIASLGCAVYIKFSIEYKKNEIVRLNKTNDSLVREKEKIVEDNEAYKNELDSLKDESVDRIDEDEIRKYIKGNLEKALSE